MSNSFMKVSLNTWFTSKRVGADPRSCSTERGFEVLTPLRRLMKIAWNTAFVFWVFLSQSAV